MSTILLYQNDQASQQSTLFLDLETFSETDIKKAGGYRYAQDSEILLYALAVDDGDVEVLEDSPESRQYVQKLITNAGKLVAHNSMFDRVVLKAHGFKDIEVEKWHDTMIQANIHSLPAGLGDLSKFLGLEGEDAKDVKNGKRLLNLFSKPQAKNSKIKRYTKHTHPSDWELFKEYAKRDVVAMRECYKRMPAHNNNLELPLWRLDQHINDRGIKIDLDFINKVLKLVSETKLKLAESTHDLTDGALNSTTKTAALLNLIKENYGIKLPDLQKTTIEKFLDDNSDNDLPESLVELLNNRCLASNSTISKYQTMLDAVCQDGRLHGLLQFAGASRTGRWSGRLVQPQNLPRPHFDFQDTDYLIDLIKQDALDIYTDDVINVAASCIRGALVADDNKKLVVSDLSAIEGRVLAWLAGETWVLNGYREYDKGIGRDMYVRTYANSFKVSQDSVTKDQRQMGKIQELALGYQGGVGAFTQFATVYGIDLDALAETVIPTLSADVLQRSASTYDWFCEQDKKPELNKRTWMAIDSLKILWRDSHPKTQQLWKATEDACRDAIANKGHVFTINSKLKVYCSEDNLLRIKLPSGRYLCYPNAHISKDGNLQYEGKHQTTGKWVKLYTYAGKLVENITQAVARDVLANNLQAIDDSGYKILLTVHDEVITEVPDSPAYSHEELSRLMSVTPSWAQDLPLASAGYEAYRYKKD